MISATLSDNKDNSETAGISPWTRAPYLDGYRGALEQLLAVPSTSWQAMLNTYSCHPCKVIALHLACVVALHGFGCF